LGGGILDLKINQIEITIKGFIIFGVLMTIVTRIFSLLISTSLIKGLFFQGLISFIALSLCINRPVFWDVASGNVFQAVANTFTPPFFYMEVLGVSILSLFIIEVLMLLPPQKIISRGLFRERMDSLEKLKQCFLKPNIKDAVLDAINSENVVSKINWVTGTGYEEIVEKLTILIDEAHKHEQDIEVKILTNEEVYNKWKDKYSTILAFVGVVNRLGPHRFIIIINENIALEGLEMPIGVKSASTAIETRDPTRIRYLHLLFEDWYSSFLTQLAS
jgi:hypothetical protein